MRSSRDFTSVTRAGRRARHGGLVVYLLSGPSDAPIRCGLIVGKAVGGSVVRHGLARKLRAQLASRLDVLPDSSQVVVRALPAAASHDSARLGSDLDRSLARLAGSGSR